MLGNYRTILAERRARAFTLAGLISRMPMSMTGLAIVLMVQNRTDSYAIGASVAATASIAGASLAPLLSKAADRYGQSRLLRISCAAQALMLIALISTVSNRVSPATYICAALLGGSTASVGAFIRARWSGFLADRSMLQTAFAWESIVDEAIFIVGPVMTTFASAQIHDAAPFAVSLTFLIAGSLWLSTQHASEPHRTAADRGSHAGAPGGTKPRWPAATPGIAGVIVSAMFLGAKFAAADITTVAFATEHGQRAASGVMLGLWALGSLVGGIVYGSRPPSTRLNVTYSKSATALALVLLPLPLVAAHAPARLAMTGLMMFASGLCIAPTLASAFALVDQMSDRARVTETLAWTMSGLGLGIAAMGPIIGGVIDRFGAERAFWLVSALGVAHAVMTYINLPASTKRLRLVAHETAVTPTAGTQLA